MNRRDSLRSAIFVHSKVLITRVLMFLPDISPWDRTQAHLLSKVGRKIQPPLDLCNVPLKLFKSWIFFLSRKSGIIYVSHRQDWICQGQQSALQAVQEPRQRAELYRSYQNWKTKKPQSLVATCNMLCLSVKANLSCEGCQFLFH